MLATTSSTEIAEWFALFKIKNEEHDQMMEEASSGTSSGGLKLPDAEEIRRGM